jgi:hypothetical protein
MRYEEILTQTEAALASGRLSERDLERLLDRSRTRPASSRPGVAGVLGALGVLVVFVGLAMLYLIQWRQMHGDAKAFTPFLFPAVAVAAAIGLQRAGRAIWESELAGMVGFVALGLAFLAAVEAINPADGALFGVVAGGIATAVVLMLHLVLRNVRLTGWGLSAALVALTGSGASYAGLEGDAAGWAVAAQAVIAALAGGLFFGRSRDAANAALRTSLLLFYAAALIGQSEYGYGHLSVWHLVISLAVAAAFVLAASLDFDGLVWVGAVGTLIWLGIVACLIGPSSGWAVAMVLIGLGLVGLSLLVVALRRRRPSIG